MNILMLGAGRRVSLVNRLKRAGQLEGEEVNVFAYEDSVYCAISNRAKVIAGKKWTDPSFKSDLFSIIEREKINVVIPLMDGATVALSELSGEIKNCWACVSRADLCNTFYDKRKSEDWFVSHNVRTPLFRENEEIVFPAIVKDAFGFGAKGQYVVQNVRELADACSILKRYVVQPFIKGREYSVDAYVSKSGETLGCVTRIRLHVIGGEVCNSITKKNSLLENECRRILSLGGFQGPITLQAIETTEGFYFLEINPRFGGGVILSMEAGADFAGMVIREALSRPVGKTEWREELMMTRAYQETFHEGVKLWS